MGEIYSEKQKFQIEEEFRWIQDKCYLDYAGAAIYSSRQIEATSRDLCTNLYGNPHSLNEVSKSCSDGIDQIRIRILKFFHTNSDEYSIIFTSGATGAIKLLLESFSWDGTDDENSLEDEEHWYDAIQGRGTYIYTASNHTSVVGGRELAAEKGACVICLSDPEAEDLLNAARLAKANNPASNSLFAYPAQCNFSGRKFPLEWVEPAKNGALSYCLGVEDKNTKWYTLLDAATYCATNDLDLSRVLPDFVCVSFYKIFGYPTGLGALLVRNASAGSLRKRYFSGGTVDVALPNRRFHMSRKCLHDRFEDGTLPYLSILALGHGLDTLQRLGLTMREVGLHVFTLARLTALQLKRLQHWNGQPLVEVYADSDFSDIRIQGGIVAFNLKRCDGSYIGYVEVLHVANSYKVQLRTGCFCNIGACQRHLRMTDDQLLDNYQAGHVCGDERDLVGGRPTGAVRVSFGYPSSSSDVSTLIHMLTDTFLESKSPLEPPVLDTGTHSVGKRPTVESIRLYPVKSCGAMKVSSWPLTERGLHLDRQWMVVTSTGVCLTQKQEPLLCRVLPTVDLATELLTLTFGGADPLVITSEKTNEEGKAYNLCTHKVCGDRVEGEDCGASAAAWLSRHLQRDGLRLVQQRRDDARRSKIQELRGRSHDATAKLSLANQAQYLLVSTSSIDWLKQRIEDEPNFNPDTLVDRFRANFIVRDADLFDEMNWQFIKIGAISFKVEGPCTRCQMICIDQQTGEKNRKPLVELSRALEGKLRFGIYCSHFHVAGDSTIHVGDPVFVQSSAT